MQKKALNFFLHLIYYGTKSPRRLDLRGDLWFYTPSLLRRMISASSGVVVEV